MPMASITEQVDQVFAAWDKPDSPGCALAVMRDGEIVYKRGYGMANLEHDVPITPATIFHVASVSKQFTAFAIALLAAEGKVSLDDEVRPYVAELPDFGVPITIRQLIHHTGGLREQFALATMAGWRIGGDVITTGDVLELVARQRELNFAPGAEHLYCNTGYTLLGVIAERVAGKSLRAFCAERIFGPLGMRNTHFHDDHTMLVRNRAYPYAPAEGGGFMHGVLFSLSTAGASGVFTTVEDLALWDENFYRCAVGGQEVIAQMHERGVLSSGEQIRYAFGLWIDDYRGLRAVQHDGEDAGFRCHMMRFPEQHFAVAVLGNLSTLNVVELAQRVADIYLADALADKGGSAGATQPNELAPEGPASHADVAPIPYKAAVSTKPTGESLAEYAGSYYSPELDATCRLCSQEGRLGVQRRKYDTVWFTRTSGDAFAVEGAEIVLERDERKRITGFKVTAAGVRNLRFVRQNA